MLDLPQTSLSRPVATIRSVPMVTTMSTDARSAAMPSIPARAHSAGSGTMETAEPAALATITPSIVMVQV